MQPHKDAERTAHYRRQASACAAAALTTGIAEIKQAYLELEQGWLCLAPKGNDPRTGPLDLATGGCSRRKTAMTSPPRCTAKGKP
jgi:hypothetical protein